MQQCFARLAMCETLTVCDSLPFGRTLYGNSPVMGLSGLAGTGDYRITAFSFTRSTALLTAMSVSYTHLDVYKRQTLDRPFCFVVVSENEIPLMIGAVENAMQLAE